MSPKDQIFLRMAGELATLGTCERAHVGAIIIKEGRAVSWGYNGAPPGMPHCNQNAHGWAGMAEPYAEGCRNAIHAEANAICFAARQGITTLATTLYVTMSPCLVCARLLIACGVEKVVYSEAYRDTEGLELLSRAGLELIQGG